MFTLLSSSVHFSMAHRTEFGWNRLIYASVSILFPCLRALGMWTQRTLYRDFWVIYRGLGLLAVVWFGISPTPFPPSPVSKLSLSFSVFPCVAGWRGVKRGWGRSKIIRLWESLARSKSFNTLWPYASSHPPSNSSPKERWGPVIPHSLLLEFWKGGEGGGGAEGGEGLTNAEDWPFRHETERGHRGRMRSNKRLHCKKRFAVLPSPDGMSLTKLSLAGNNFIIPGQGVRVTSRLKAGKLKPLFYSVLSHKGNSREGK